MKIHIPQKITVSIKKIDGTPGSSPAVCTGNFGLRPRCKLRGELRAPRSLQVPRQTVIGIGLRKISSKFCLPSVRAARRHCRCLAFRLFYFIIRLFPVYTFSMRKSYLRWRAGYRSARCTASRFSRQPFISAAYFSAMRFDFSAASPR